MQEHDDRNVEQRPIEAVVDQERKGQQQGKADGLLDDAGQNRTEGQDLQGEDNPFDQVGIPTDDRRGSR